MTPKSQAITSVASFFAGNGTWFQVHAVPTRRGVKPRYVVRLYDADAGKGIISKYFNAERAAIAYAYRQAEISVRACGE